MASSTSGQPSGRFDKGTTQRPLRKDANSAAGSTSSNVDLSNRPLSWHLLIRERRCELVRSEEEPLGGRSLGRTWVVARLAARWLVPRAQREVVSRKRPAEAPVNMLSRDDHAVWGGNAASLRVDGRTSGIRSIWSFIFCVIVHCIDIVHCTAMCRN